jgi:transcriptional regulator GlxA family with amidase domain
VRTSIIAFDDFTDIDVFFLWDLLNRVKEPGWQVRIVGDKPSHTSSTGLTIPMHGPVTEANDSDVVLFASGMGTRRLIKDTDYLVSLRFDPQRQLVGSMCSGALVLAALGLLTGKEATTYPTAKTALEKYGVRVVERPFVRQGNIATAAGCLAAQYLVGWVIEEKLGKEQRENVLRSVQPVGEGLFFEDAEAVSNVYAQPAGTTIQP